MPTIYDCSARDLLQKSLITLAVCGLAVVVCYQWIDRPVAFYVDRHQINDYRVFKWLTYPPPWMQSWSPLILAVLMVRRAFGPFARWQHVLLAACLGLLVADEFRTSLGDLFGRYWPETRFNNNPSLIGNGTYGFHPFQHGDDIGSFPSGHAARILGFAGVWWLAMPGSRPLLLIVCPPLLASLVAMNYHFVGDVVAGSVIGGIVAMNATWLGEPRETCNRHEG